MPHRRIDQLREAPLLLAARHNAAAREGVQSEDVPLDEETLEELRSLGYVK